MKSRLEDLNVWKSAMELTVKCYQLCSNAEELDRGLQQQIQRSSVSIPSNIAEGFERQSSKEFVRFLFIAKGSAGELRCQLMIGLRLKYWEDHTVNSIISQLEHISRMLAKLIQTIQYKNRKNTTGSSEG